MQSCVSTAICNKTTHLPTRASSHSSNLWLERQKNDVYKKRQRYDNYRARSAYKLIEIDDKYQFLKPGKVVLDVGAAPGSWSQVIVDRLKLTKDDMHSGSTGMCLAIDLAAIQPLEGAVCIGNADFTSPFTQANILTWLNGRKVDCILSDMSPKVVGFKYMNHENSYALIRKLLPFAYNVLRRETGLLLFKLFQGEKTEDLCRELDAKFETVRRIKPDASRDDSSELYVLCRNYNCKTNS